MGRNGFYISTDCFLDGFVDGSCCSCGGAIFGSADVGVNSSRHEYFRLGVKAPKPGEARMSHNKSRQMQEALRLLDKLLSPSLTILVELVIERC